MLKQLGTPLIATLKPNTVAALINTLDANKHAIGLLGLDHEANCVCYKLFDNENHIILVPGIINTTPTNYTIISGAEMR
jgi:hypothetical protein